MARVKACLSRAQEESAAARQRTEAYRQEHRVQRAPFAVWLGVDPHSGRPVDAAGQLLPVPLANPAVELERQRAIGEVRDASRMEVALGATLAARIAELLQEGVQHMEGYGARPLVLERFRESFTGADDAPSLRDLEHLIGVLRMGSRSPERVAEMQQVMRSLYAQFQYATTAASAAP